MSEQDTASSPIAFDDLPSDVQEAAGRFASVSQQAQMALRAFRDVVEHCDATQEQIVAMYWIFADEIPAEVLAVKLDPEYVNAGAAALAGAWGERLDRQCESCGRDVYAHSRSDKPRCECGRFR